MIEISQLGIIGNCKSAVLISQDGTIVWSCLPDFDSSSVFAQLLDSEIGGEMAIIPVDKIKINQSYVDKTNILLTRYETISGIFEVFDFMPFYLLDHGSYYKAPEIYRYIKLISGEPKLCIHYNPKLNYATEPTQSIIHDEYIKSITTKGEYHYIYLYSNLPYSKILEEKQIILKNDVFLLISYHQKIISVDIDRAALELDRTRFYWLNWVNRTPKYPMYQKEIIRSALTLKMLPYHKTGAVIAAITTSIPENLKRYEKLGLSLLLDS